MVGREASVRGSSGSYGLSLLVSSLGGGVEVERGWDGAGGGGLGELFVEGGGAGESVVGAEVEVIVGNRVCVCDSGGEVDVELFVLFLSEPGPGLDSEMELKPEPEPEPEPEGGVFHHNQLILGSWCVREEGGLIERVI